MADATRPKFSIYKARDAQNVAEKPMMAEFDQRDMVGLGGMIEEGLMDGGQAMVLYEDEAAGMSLTHNWFKAHYPLPRHAHNADCLYYIVSGEVRMGTETLRAGDGFFVPADDLYTYEVGDEGVEMLEFRTKAVYDVKFKTADAMWAKLRDKTIAARGRWPDAKPPLSVRRMAGEEA